MSTRQKLIFISLIIFLIFSQHCKKSPTTPEPPELPVIKLFTASTTEIEWGKSSTLSWEVEKATQIEITPEIGTVSATGSKEVSPTETTTYTLTAKNNDGQTTKTCTITVTAAPVKAGEWTATSDFGSFDFIVSSGSNYITKITYKFASWSCGGVTISGTIIISKSPGWPISNRSFEIENYLDPNRKMQLTIKGTFSDSGVQASGSWEAKIYGSTCSGSWQGSSKS